MHVCIYIYIYVCVYLSLSISLSLYIYIHIYIYIYIYKIEDDAAASKTFGVHASPRSKTAFRFGWNVTQAFRVPCSYLLYIVIVDNINSDNNNVNH